MFPLSTCALTRAQAGRRELAKEYRNAFILDGVENSLRRFEKVNVVAPWGDTAARRLLSRLTDAWRISVTLTEPLSYELEDVKRMVVDCLGAPETIDGLSADAVDLRQVAMDIQGSHTISDLLVALRLPPPEEALDVL
ncbi:hypothetical protein [Ramlibacter sp.]|uniref:hypothetical protein n=1 Tax=Ramlibacter sp. TaxID=1917967 RepID=UPI003D126044